MEIYQLKHFLAVADTASFTKAAHRMHITQPALSGSISRLESELGARLFTRTRKAVALTPAGRRLFEEGTQIVRACDRVKADIQGGGEPRRLKLGLIRTFPTSRIVSLLKAFRTEHPDLEITIAEGSSGELDDKLRRHKLDLLLTILGTTQEPGFVDVRLLEERYMLYVSNRSPFADCKEVSLAALQGQALIVRSACETYASTTNLLKERGITTRLVCRTDQDDRALAFVRAEVGVALMPELFEAPGVVRVAVTDFPANRTIGLRWLPTNSHETIGQFHDFALSHRWS